MSDEIIRIGFHGGELEAVKRGDDVFVSIKRACEHLGIMSCLLGDLLL